MVLWVILSLLQSAEMQFLTELRIRDLNLKSHCSTCLIFRLLLFTLFELDSVCEFISAECHSLLPYLINALLNLPISFKVQNNFINKSTLWQCWMRRWVEESCSFPPSKSGRRSLRRTQGCLQLQDRTSLKSTMRIPLFSCIATIFTALQKVAVHGQTVESAPRQGMEEQKAFPLHCHSRTTSW